MQEIDALYRVERQSAGAEDWVAVAHCRSVRYAVIIASAGLRRSLGTSYRVVCVATGRETALHPAFVLKAA